MLSPRVTITTDWLWKMTNLVHTVHTRGYNIRYAIPSCDNFDCPKSGRSINRLRVFKIIARLSASAKTRHLHRLRQLRGQRFGKENSEKAVLVLIWRMAPQTLARWRHDSAGTRTVKYRQKVELV